MKLSVLKTSIKQALAQDHPHQVLEELHTHLDPQSPAFEVWVSLSGRFSSFEKERMAGLLSRVEVREENNRIRTALQEFTDKLEPSDLLASAPSAAGQVMRLEAENKLLREQVAYLKSSLDQYANTSLDDRESLSELEGKWVEVIERPGQDRFQLALAEFKWRKRKGIFEYKGQTFSRHGEVMYAWDSIRLLPDLPEEKIYYIYTVANEKSSPSDRSVGFGLLRLDEMEDHLFLDKGYFFGAGSEQSPKYFTCYELKVLQELCRLEFGWTHQDLDLDMGPFMSWLHKIFISNPEGFNPLYRNYFRKIRLIPG